MCSCPHTNNSNRSCVQCFILTVSKQLIEEVRIEGKRVKKNFNISNLVNMLVFVGNNREISDSDQWIKGCYTVYNSLLRLHSFRGVVPPCYDEGILTLMSMLQRASTPHSEVWALRLVKTWYCTSICSLSCIS